MLDLLKKYNVELSFTDADVNRQALITLRNVYAAEVTALKGEADKQESVNGGWIKALGASVENREDIVNALKTFKSAVRELMYQLVDNDSDIVIPLVDALADVKTDAMNERDYWVQKVKRENTVTKPKDDEYDSRLSDASDLAELIRLSFKMVGSSLDLTDAEFLKNFPLEDKVEKGIKTGEKLPNLPRLPNKRAESAGRNASHRFIHFTWKGEAIPAGTLVADIAHDYVSDLSKGFVINGTEIVKAVKDAGHEFGSPTGWSIEFPTGILTGQDVRPDKSTASSETESEDTDTE